MTVDKAALVDAFASVLAERLHTLLAEQEAARAGTRVDGSHRPANRGERAAVSAQGYLALALDRRIEALQEAQVLLGQVERGPARVVGAGALVSLRDEDDVVEHILILPGGLGDRVGDVVVVSPRSPVARALAGLRPGDLGRLVRGGRAVEVEIEAVR